MAWYVLRTWRGKRVTQPWAVRLPFFFIGPLGRLQLGTLGGELGGTLQGAALVC
jgi:hypothetical protein